MDLQLFEVELLRWESVNDLSDEKDGSLMKKVLKEGDLNVWDSPMEPDLVTIKLSAKVAGTEEYFEKDLVQEFKMKDGFFCPAVRRILQGMKKGETVQVKVRGSVPFTNPSCTLPAGSTVTQGSTRRARVCRLCTHSCALCAHSGCTRQLRHAMCFHRLPAPAVDALSHLVLAHALVLERSSRLFLARKIARARATSGQLGTAFTAPRYGAGRPQVCVWG